MKTQQNKPQNKQAVCGSLLGLAAGDALGYPIEHIYKGKAPQPITGYLLDAKTGKACISANTQLMLCTLQGILIAETRVRTRGAGTSIDRYVQIIDQRWAALQGQAVDARRGVAQWLLSQPEMRARRAPGKTCIEALKDGVPNPEKKSPGSIVRTAPVGLYYDLDVKRVPFLAEKIVSITHPATAHAANVYASILYDLVYAKMDLYTAIAASTSGKVAQEEFDLWRLLELSFALAHNTAPDEENMYEIGRGWSAEKALARAVYCAARYQGDFSSGILAAVQYGGDVDAIGALTGSLLGAMCGLDGIDEKWTKNLELYDTILRMATDAAGPCPVSACSPSTPENDAWLCRYEG